MLTALDAVEEDRLRVPVLLLVLGLNRRHDHQPRSSILQPFRWTAFEDDYECLGP
jgi:hypothetical protein